MRLRETIVEPFYYPLCFVQFPLLFKDIESRKKVVLVISLHLIEIISNKSSMLHSCFATSLASNK